MADLINASRAYLASIPQVTDMVGSNATYDTFIFRWRKYVELEGTGSAMIVLSQRPGLTANQHNTLKFPNLQVEIYVDPPRNAGGNPLHATTPEDRCMAIAEVVDSYLHTVDGHDRTWADPVNGGSVRVLRCTRGTDVDITDVPDADGMVRGLMRYEVKLG